jgi:Zn-dependent protease
MNPTPPPGPWEPAVETAVSTPVADERQPLHKRLGGFLIAGVFLLVKFGKLALIFLGKAKFLTTAGSMLVSVAAYSLIWGWKFAAGFVVLLFVHEMGHYVQLRREGVKPSGMLFIPFLGAAVGTRSLGGNALAEARVGLAGPITGTLGTALLIPLSEATGNEMWRALAFTGFFLNLFNLAPVVPLDGGRAMAALAPWMWFVGLGAMFTMVFVFPNPIIILIALLGAYTTYGRWKTRKSGAEGNEDYYKVSKRGRMLVFAVYMALIVACVVGMDATHLERTFDDV